jgi:hypothetical protein
MIRPAVAVAPLCVCINGMRAFGQSTSEPTHSRLQMIRSKFIPVILAVLPLAGATQDVFAQQPSTANISVPTGKKRLVGFFTNLNPDCSTAGEIDARVTKQPENGTVEVETGTGFANYADNNQRHACNLKPSPGMRVTYTSKESFIGSDTFEVEFLSGISDVVWKYAVTVK